MGSWHEGFCVRGRSEARVKNSLHCACADERVAVCSGARRGALPGRVRAPTPSLSTYPPTHKTYACTAPAPGMAACMRSCAGDEAKIDKCSHVTAGTSSQCPDNLFLDCNGEVAMPDPAPAG